MKLFALQGFTLIELLLVIAIFVVLAAASAPMYSKWLVVEQEGAVTSQIVQALRLAKAKSEAGLNYSPHGVYFEENEGNSDRFILYQGNSYAARDSDYDIETVVSDILDITTNLAGQEINFSVGLGEPSTTGTITIINKSSGRSITVAVNELGVISE